MVLGTGVSRQTKAQNRIYYMIEIHFFKLKAQSDEAQQTHTHDANLCLYDFCLQPEEQGTHT